VRPPRRLVRREEATVNEEADPRTLPTWVHVWDDPTVNYGRTGGMLRPPFYKRDREIAELEMHVMLSDLEYHANWGV
jgi:hypothetical protein